MASPPVYIQNSTTGRTLLAPYWVRSGLKAVDLVAPSISGALMQRLYFRPPRKHATDKQQAILSRADAFELDVEGTAVACRQWGAGGRAIWLVHGWGGHLGQLTPFVDPLVQRGFRVIGFDWPAHGESGGSLSSLLHAHRTLTRLRRLVGAPYGDIAHSFGAAATTLALGNGLEAERVVYQAPVARLRPYIERFSSALSLSERMRKRFIDGAESWLEAPFANFEPMRFAAEIRTPVLILHSRDDKEVPSADGASLAAAWPNARIDLKEGLGHRRILDDESCIAETVAFLSAPTSP